MFLKVATILVLLAILVQANCKVDYKEENESDLFYHETREEFAQVPVKVEATSYYRPKVRFERFEFCGVFLVGLLVFLALIFNC